MKAEKHFILCAFDSTLFILSKGSDLLGSHKSTMAFIVDS